MRSRATRTAVAFVVWSAFWVVLSDYVLQLVAGTRHFWLLQTGKGLLYVAVSGALLLLAIRSMERDEVSQRLIAESKLQLLRESGLIGIASWGEDKKIEYANEALCQLLGYDRAELIGTDVWTLVSRECAFTMEQAQEELQAHGRTELHRFELLRRDGSRVPIIGGLALLGQMNERTAYFVDISELTKSEEERAKLTEQLLHSQKINALGQLAGGVAHNFNNELAIIVGYASMIGTSANLDEVPKRAEQILKAADRARKLVAQLLAFSRKQTLRREPIDLNVVLGEMQPELRQLLSDNIELHVSSSQEEECIEVDRSQLEQAIINLVVNAQDAMPGGGTLTLEVGHAKDELATVERGTTGEHAYLAISDSGSGMDEATKERIFEPFFTTKQRTGGTGLGLSTVYGIVKQSGGEISVTSHVNEGTRFTLQFPRVPHKRAEGQNDLPTATPHAMTGTVLLVEDMDAVREMMAEILRAKGLTILPARDGLQAVDIAQAHQGEIDLVLTDVVMPRMNGPEAARIIRESRPDAKVVYFSGYTDLIDQGAADVIIWKPVRPETLISTVRECLNRDSGSGSHETSAA